jgi:hypothetical protein
MTKLLISIGIGALAGLIDVTPMLMRHVDRSTVLSAFTHWVVVGVLTAYIRLPTPSWLNGLLVALLTALPVVVQRANDNPQSALGILTMSIVLGAGIGWATGRFVG